MTVAPDTVDLLDLDPHARFLRFARMWLAAATPAMSTTGRKLAAQDVIRFARWSRGCDVEPLEELADLRRYEEWMAAKPLSARTMRHATRTLEDLRAYLHDPLTE